MALLAVAVFGITAVGWASYNSEVDRTTAEALAESTPIPTPEPTAAPDLTGWGGGASIRSVRETIASSDPLAISVLGDSTGNAGDEWVYLWAEHLAESRAVTFRAWDDAVGGEYGPPLVLSTEGPEMVIWNGSAPGRDAEYPASVIGKMQPEEPDLVIYNFGHNNSTFNLRQELGLTLETVERRWDAAPPSLTILQNPARGDTARRQAATVAALRSDVAPAFGLPAVDVWAAFEDDGRPLTALVSNADGLGVHPTLAGSLVWVAAVIEALG